MKNRSKQNKNTEQLAIMESPLGDIYLLAHDTALTGLYMGKEHLTEVMPSVPIEAKNHPILAQTVAQLEEYFAGKRQDFDLPLDGVGTDFQKTVWHALLTIPFGETCAYQAIAVQIGKPTASRAVGMANGRNPISIIVPCHRVIGKNGDLVGYGSGLPRKTWLLHHESLFLQQATQKP